MPAACLSRSRRQQLMPEPQPISTGSNSHGRPAQHKQDACQCRPARDRTAAELRTIGAESWTIADGNDGGNRQIVKVDAVGVIDRKLSGALTGPVNKVYDGTDTARYAGRNVGSARR